MRPDTEIDIKAAALPSTGLIALGGASIYDVRCEWGEGGSPKLTKGTKKIS